MIEPAKFAIKIALETVQKYVTEAQKYSIDDAERCQLYLDAARSAVYGLIEESQEIVLQAREINLDKPDQVEQLIHRINEYLFLDNLRLRLNDVIGALNGIRDGLQHHADRFFLWPGVKKNRGIAVARYAALLDEMVSNLDSLKVTLMNRQDPSATGVGAEVLQNILAVLKLSSLHPEMPKNDLRKQLDESIDASGAHLSLAYDNWMRLLRDIMGTYELLNIEFKRSK